MQASPALRNVRTVKEVHPAVYGLLAGCVLWIVAAAWFFFAADRYAALQLAVVAGFAAAFLITPLCLYRLSGKKAEAGSFREWLDSEIELPDGTLPAKSALAIILCAPVACAAGLTAVSLVAWLAAGGLI